MKKLLSIILLLCTLCALASCSTETSGGVQKEVNSTGTTEPDTTEPEELTFALNETAVFDRMKMTATDIVVSNGSEYVKPSEGNVFIGVKFTIENISDEEDSVSSLLLFDAYVDDVKASMSLTGSMIDGFSGTLDGTIAAGKKLEGWYVVEAASGAKALQLDVQQDWLSSTKASFVFDIPA